MTEKKEEQAVAPTEEQVVSATTEEGVSSPEVKEEPVEAPEAPERVEVPEKAEAVDAAKLQEQVENLNIALKKEREASRGSKETIESLKEKLDSTSETLERMKTAFAPSDPEPTPEEEPKYLTAEQLEEFLAKKEEEKRALQAKEEYAKKIKEEISNLEKDLDGKDGKPKYDDQKVIEWQDANGKLHLSPSEAFYEMNRNEIIDWEIKQRMANKPSVENVERPGGTPAGREPSTPEKLKTDMEIRQAVEDAMDAAMADLNT